MNANEAFSRMEAVLFELSEVHDRIKYGGVDATFPYEHHWNAYPVVDLLEKAESGTAEAVRLLSKVIAEDGAE